MKNKTTLWNMLTAILLQIMTVISGFIIPKIILSYFGSEVNGLVSSINQFLSYISLVEGGIAGVISANLYKPIIEKDDNKISSIIVAAQKFYKKIGQIFIAYTVILSVVYPLMWGKNFNYIYVCTLVLVLSITMMVQYMFSLTLKTFLSADKKLYIVNVTQIIITVLNVLFAYVTVKIYPSIHVLKLVSGVLYVLQPVIFGYFVKKNYAINWKAESSNELIKERWSGFAINIAAFIHNSTDIVILTIFTTLQTVSIYSVYVLVTSGLKNLVNSVFTSINPTLGQAYASGNAKELNKKMDIYEYITMLLVFFFFTIAALLITPFVLIYTDGINDANYNQAIFGYLVVLSEALYLIKNPHLSLSYVANKFKEVTAPAYIEAAINIAVSLVLVGKFGLIGVAIGTTVAMVYRMAFHVYFTTRLINGRKQWIFYRKLVFFAIFTAIGIILCEWLMPLNQITLVNWIVHAVGYCFVFAALFFLLSVLAFRKELEFFIGYIKR